MIVASRPNVVETYDKLFEKGYIILTFTKQTNNYKRFEDAVEGSREFLFYHNENWFVDPRGSSFINALRNIYTRP